MSNKISNKLRFLSNHTDWLFAMGIAALSGLIMLASGLLFLTAGRGAFPGILSSEILAPAPTPALAISSVQPPSTPAVAPAAPEAAPVQSPEAGQSTGFAGSQETAQPDASVPATAGQEISAGNELAGVSVPPGQADQKSKSKDNKGHGKDKSKNHEPPGLNRRA